MSSFCFINIKHCWSRMFQFCYYIVQNLKPCGSGSSKNSTKLDPSPAFLTQILAVLQKNLYYLYGYLVAYLAIYLSSSLLIGCEFLGALLKNYSFPDSFADRNDTIEQVNECKHKVLGGASRKDALKMKDSATISFCPLLLNCRIVT